MHGTKPQNSFNIIVKRVMRKTQFISYFIFEAQPRLWKKDAIQAFNTMLLLLFISHFIYR